MILTINIGDPIAGVGTTVTVTTPDFDIAPADAATLAQAITNSAAVRNANMPSVGGVWQNTPALMSATTQKTVNAQVYPAT